MIGAAGSAETWTEAFCDSPARVVMARQCRIINDYPLPGWLAACLHPDIVLNWVLDAQTEATDIPITRKGKIVAERDRQGMLRGSVKLLVRMDEKQTRKKQDAALKALSGVMRSWNGAKADRHSVGFDSTVIDFRSHLQGIVESSGPAISIEFALMRTGECRIWYDAEPVGVAQDHLDRVAEQAYYFIKDVVHTHSHHDQTSDQITPLYRFGRRTDEPGHDDEVAWRRETLWSLSREIERLNREGDLTDQRRALGIIAYAEAFQGSLMGHVRIVDEPAPFTLFGKSKALKPFKASTAVHDYDFKHLKDSIKAGIDVNSTRLAQRIQIAITATTVFLSSTSLAISLISAHNGGLLPGKETDKLGLGFLEQIVPCVSANPLVASLAFTAIAVTVITNYLFDGRAGAFFRYQRVISQFIRAAAVSVVRPIWGQFCFVVGGHLLSIALTVGAMLLCLAVLIGAFD